MRTLVTRSLRVALAVVFMLSLFAGMALPAHAQQPSPDRLYPPHRTDPVQVGVRAGITSSDFFGESVESANPELGFHGGLFLTYRPHPRFAIQPEVLFTTQRANLIQSTVFESAGSVDYKLGYLDIPVLFKMYLPQQAETQFSLFAGPYVGFRLYDKVEDVNKALGDLDPALRTMRYGVATGLSFSSYTGRNELIVDARYDVGLADLFEDKDLPAFRNRGFTVSVGLGF